MAHVVEHASLSALQEGFRTVSDARTPRHYQVIWLLAQGRTVGETAALTNFVPRWIEELLARYNALGLVTLGDRRRGNGAARKLLTPALLARLRVRLESPPSEGGVWTSRKAAAFMAAGLGLESVSVQRGWEALRAVGFTIQAPRPRHAKTASADEQEAFKKKASPRLLPPSRPATTTR